MELPPLLRFVTSLALILALLFPLLFVAADAKNPEADACTYISVIELGGRRRSEFVGRIGRESSLCHLYLSQRE